MKGQRENVYSFNLGVDSKGRWIL